MSRKIIIDSVEDYILSLGESDEEYLSLVRIYFNYPGFKKAVIDFGKVLVKVSTKQLNREAKNILQFPE